MLRDRTYSSALPLSSATHPGPLGRLSPVLRSRTGPGMYTLTSPIASTMSWKLLKSTSM